MEDYGGTGKENVTYRSLYTTSKIVKDSGDTDLETQDDPIKTIENRKYIHANKEHFILYNLI